MVVVLESECSGSEADGLVVSFNIYDNENVESSAGKDEHDPRYDDLIQSIDLVDLDIDPSSVPEGLCIPKVSQRSDSTDLEYTPPITLSVFFPSRLRSVSIQLKSLKNHSGPQDPSS